MPCLYTYVLISNSTYFLWVMHVLLWEPQTETQDNKAFQEIIFISMPAMAHWIYIQRLSHENKEVSPCTPLQTSYRAKSKLSPIYGCMQLYWLLNPQCYVTFFTFRFFKFYLPAMPSSPPFHIIRKQTCLFLFWPSPWLHYSPLWCLDPPRVKEHHLDLRVCIFIASLHGPSV
jgi:hypothetical protein